MLIRKRSGALVVAGLEAMRASAAADGSGSGAGANVTASWPSPSLSSRPQPQPQPQSSVPSPGSTPLPLDLSSHVLASDGRHLLLVDRRPEQRTAASTLIFGRIDEYHDMAFVPLAAPCARCGGQSFWAPKQTPQQRQAAIERLSGAIKAIGRLVRVVSRVQCEDCEKPKIASLVAGMLYAIRVGPGDVMADRVVVWMDGGNSECGLSGWMWESEIEDAMMDRVARQGEDGPCLVPARPWYDWPSYDRAMGLRVFIG